MTIYVNELPKDCEECPCCNKDVDYGSCCNLGAYEYDDYFCINQKHPRCPLQSLADYTKQVKKEVVQEIRQYVEKNKGILVGDFNHQTLKRDEIEVCNVNLLNEFLDQIQGKIIGENL